jgi:glucosamine-6-phosphate deaminase
MEVIIHPDPQSVASRAADIVCDALKKNPASVLGLATGSTPLALYAELILRCRAGAVSFRGVTSFNLDEYVGLDPSHGQSYRHYMDENLFRHIDIDRARTHVPDGKMENPMDSGPAYEAAIGAAGGIDLQILGIGANGHIGFNEPTSALHSRTRVKTLAEKTVRDNSRFFKPGEFQPHLAITMGIGTILEARRIVLLATGEAKSDAVSAMVEGPVSAMCPASALQFHVKTTVICDQAAAAKLRMREYYNFVLAQQDALNQRFGMR